MAGQMKSWRVRWPLTAEFMRRAQEGAPCRYPVVVRTKARVLVEGDECYGSTHIHTRAPRHFIIVIESSCSDLLAREWLHHEWAHALAWGRETGDHDKAWSDSWGEIYRAVYVHPKSVLLSALWDM